MKQLLVAFLLVTCCSATDEYTKKYFKEQCSGCHTIGGGHRIGPDLKHAGKQKDLSRVQFHTTPGSSVPGDSTHALRLRKGPDGDPLPTFPNMTPGFARVLLQFIKAESTKSPSGFAGLTISHRKFTPADVRAGSDIYMGSRKLKNGGPSCASCHTVAGMRPDEALGPDLTHGFARLKVRNSLATYLANPPANPMTTIYQSAPLTRDEIESLVAYLEDTDKRFK